jgi:hypothetical protein
MRVFAKQELYFFLLKIKEYQNEEESQHVLAGPCANFILCSPNLDNLKALICSCWLS